VVNYGLSEIPDEVHAVTLGPLSGSSEPMHLGTQYVVLRATLAATNTFTFLNTQVKAASGYTSVPDSDFEIVGIDLANLTWYPAPAGLTIPYTNVSLALAKDSTSVVLSGSYTGDVEAVVFYNIKSPSSPNKWVEVGRGGKSVRASFEWHQEEVDFGVPGPTGPYSFDIGTAHWQHAEVAGRFNEMPLVWTKANPGDVWTAVTEDSSDITFGYPQSNLVSMEFTLGILRYALFVFPKHVPLGSGITQHVQIDYTYTPYQGLSKTGGTPFDPADLSPLRDKLHGVVKANTDFFATQGGPCSYYGGVDSWGGTPARIPSSRTALYNAKFTEYNQTQLVKPNDNAMGVLDWSSSARGRSYLNAAVVMRLPFPANPNMVGYDPAVGVIDYHSGTMEWDLDPGNEGASSGFFSYAPGYPSIFTTLYPPASVTPEDKVRYDHFVNALTPLALPGEMSEEDKSIFIAASAENAMELTGGAELTVNIIENRWNFPTSSTAIVETNIEPKRGSVIGRTMVKVFNMAGGGEVNSYGHRLMDGSDRGIRVIGTGIASQVIANPWGLDWTLPPLFLSAQDVFICTFPGSALAFLQLQEMDMGVTLWKDFSFGASGSTRKMGSTLCTSARMRGYYLPSDRLTQRPRIYEPAYDLIKVAMQSGSANNSDGFGNVGNGSTSLVGRQIGYPSSWSPTTISNLETSIVGSRNFYSSYGRGVYLGNTKFRFNMPVLIPGTGTPLDQASELYTPLASLTVGRTLMSDFPDTTDQPPEIFPYEPASPLFASSPRRNLRYAFGGPLAYVFYGMTISPSSDQYKNRAVMQITGGPLMGEMNDSSNFSFSHKITKTREDNPNKVNGTALDAYWPKYRPILKSK
jgi:hypothetical protein